MEKKEERLGRERKKDDRGGLIVLWITVSGKRKFRLVAYLSICQKQKQLRPKGVQFSQWLFAAHGEQTRSVNCTPLFQMVFKEANRPFYRYGGHIELINFFLKIS